MRRDRPTLSWKGFQLQCLLRFGPAFQDDEVGELSKLRRTGSVYEYQRRFDQLLAHTSLLTSPQEINIFVSGLQESIAIDVQIQKPPDLTAMQLTRLYERKNGQHQLNQIYSGKPSDDYPKVIKRLSCTEMEERRA